MVVYSFRFKIKVKLKVDVTTRSFYSIYTFIIPKEKWRFLDLHESSNIKTIFCILAWLAT
jgi:hypothetical protein